MTMQTVNICLLKIGEFLNGTIESILCLPLYLMGIYNLIKNVPDRQDKSVTSRKT